LENQPDSELLRRSAGGDPEAFACLVRRHHQPLLNFFARLGAYTAAEDLAQETLVRLFKYRRRYRPSAKFTTFLYTVARHVWIDALRKTRRTETLAGRLREEPRASHDGGMDRARWRLDAQAALERLPEKLRGVVVLAVCQGLSYEEVAAILKIPVGTVKSRMFLAVRQLRDWLDEREQPG